MAKLIASAADIRVVLIDSKDKQVSINGSKPIALEQWLKMTNGGQGYIFADGKANA